MTENLTVKTEPARRNPPLSKDWKKKDGQTIAVPKSGHRQGYISPEQDKHSSEQHNFEILISEAESFSDIIKLIEKYKTKIPTIAKTGISKYNPDRIINALENARRAIELAAEAGTPIDKNHSAIKAIQELSGLKVHIEKILEREYRQAEERTLVRKLRHTLRLETTQLVELARNTLNLTTIVNDAKSLDDLLTAIPKISQAADANTGKIYSSSIIIRALSYIEHNRHEAQQSPTVFLQAVPDVAGLRAKVAQIIRERVELPERKKPEPKEQSLDKKIASASNFPDLYQIMRAVDTFQNERGVTHQSEAQIAIIEELRRIAEREAKAGYEIRSAQPILKFITSSNGLRDRVAALLSAEEDEQKNIWRAERNYHSQRSAPIIIEQPKPEEPEIELEAIDLVEVDESQEYRDLANELTDLANKLELNFRKRQEYNPKKDLHDDPFFQEIIITEKQSGLAGSLAESCAKRDTLKMLLEQTGKTIGTERTQFGHDLMRSKLDNTREELARVNREIADLQEELTETDVRLDFYQQVQKGEKTTEQLKAMRAVEDAIKKMQKAEDQLKALKRGFIGRIMSVFNRDKQEKISDAEKIAEECREETQKAISKLERLGIKQ